MVDTDGWDYCPKSEWKASVRDASKKVHKQSKKDSKKEDKTEDSGSGEEMKETK
jgi:hypothetical protein